MTINKPSLRILGTMFVVLAVLAAPVLLESVAFAAPPKLSTGEFYSKYINPLVALLAGAAGITVVGGIIWGGIQYSMSAGDPQKAAKAKSTISKALFGLIAFLLLASFIRFLAPGMVSNGTPTGSASTASCAAKGKFLGLKAWYAYIPDGSFYSDCTLKEDVAILPSGSNKGLVPQVALAIVDNLLRIAAMVAVVFVMVGGVKYMTSNGDPQATKQAMRSIINALVGLAIAIVAAAVVSFIGGKLTS